ncbi:MAG: MFS transporter [Clostridia bacterium]|nr:MFS transporter [Clostridia bacterium]
MFDFDSREFKRGRTMYIFEAALEFFIAMLVSGSYLATLTKALGMSDSLTGIISSFISLGCLFQLFAVFMRKSRVKPTVIVLSVINQLLFAVLYIIPLADFGATIKNIAFIVAIFSAYIIYNFAHPKKMNWFMSLVPDKKRGSFTADKEIFSLITGMIFSYSISFLFDYFKENGQIRTAFIISASVMFFIMVLHTVTMLLTVEPEEEKKPTKSLKKAIKTIVKNKLIMKVAVVLIIYNIAYYCSIPFFGTYLIGELGMSLNTVSIFTIVGNVCRILISKFWGRYADKTSFARMTEKCFLLLGLAFIFHAFATPKTALITIALYYVCNGIALGGVNSALTNLVFDYSPHEIRADALAICQAAAGLTGFLTTLVASLFVTLIQNCGNQIFGITIYAQQILSVASLIIILLAIVYLKKNFLNKK